MNDHERLREWAAAYVLDALEADERREFERHLDGCPTCRSEVASLAPLPGLMARVEPGTLEAAPMSIADRAAERVGSEWSVLVASRRRWRAAAAVAAIAAVAALAWPSGGAERIPLDVDLGEVANGQILVEGRGWGTEVEIRLQEVPVRSEYVAFAVDGEGRRQIVATWGPTSSGSMTVTGASSFPLDTVTEIQIIGDNDILATARPSA